MPEKALTSTLHPERADDRASPSSLAEHVAAAAAMVPTLRERSARCEELRSLPPETVADITAAGFPRLAQPTRFGGLGFDVNDASEVAKELGRGCCSTSWVSALYSGHNFLVSMFDLTAQEEYWGSSEDVLCCTASAVARLEWEAEDGGVRINGRFRFSSGCDFADWIILFIPAGMCLVPRSEFHIDDDWFVMGLRGTGSKAIVVDNIFVPSHRIVSFEVLAKGASPGAELYLGNPFYKLPSSISLTPLLLGPIVGMAEGLIELFDERVIKRVDPHTMIRACERPGTQLRFAEATAAVDAAALIFRDNNVRLAHLGSLPEMPTMADRARVRRDVTYAVKLCVQAANLLLEAGDASGMHDSQLIQRWGRDIHMGGLQFMATWDEPALAYSQVRWGLQPQAHTL
jgi:3-hydroxy-9,10-secoandrosta-1,3,5(10)-triene-9,17-dione monooxygenase